jgi:hypothetical protein
MTSLIIALLLSQTAPTAADIKGALISIHNAQSQLASRTITYPSGAHMACVPPANGQSTVGAKTLRVGVVAYSAEVQTALGAVPLTMTVAGSNTIVAGTNEIVVIPDTTIVKPYVYGAMEVLYFAEPNVLVPTPVIPDWLRLLPDTEVEVRAAPVWPACQIAIVREGYAAMPARCACSTGPSCLWTPPLVTGGYGAAVAAPTKMTLPPGLWSGAACVPKPCVVFAAHTTGGADLSMPEVCK